MAGTISGKIKGAVESQENRPLGVCWFRREDYAAAKATMTDPERLYETYDAWFAAMKQFEREMAERGVTVVRVRFDPVGFMLYCATRNLPPDASARIKWAAAAADAAKKPARPRH
jgi:hypothetical protein